MGEVIKLNCMTTLDFPAEDVLEVMKEKNLKQVVVIGYDENEEMYFASSMSDPAEVLWCMEKSKKYLLQ